MIKSSASDTLARSLKQRRLSQQGAALQKTLLENDARFAESDAKMISPECRHLVISQNLLPHLWKLGTLGGRTFDVLIERWLLEELQKRLDRAAKRHPTSALIYNLPITLGIVLGSFLGIFLK